MSRIATNITIFDQALVSGTNFITGLVLARILGMEGYGLFILLAGVILFSATIQNALITSPMMILGATAKQSSYYQTTAILQALFTTILFLIIVALGSLINNINPDLQLNSLLLPLALATSGFLLQDFLRRYFFSTKKNSLALINDSLSYGLQLICILIANYLYDFDVKFCLYIMALTSFLAVTHGVATSGLLIIPTKIALPDYINTLNEHWLLGKWLVAKNITYWLSTQVVIYMTGIFISVATVGAMGAALNIVGIANILFLALDNFAMPRASQFYASKGIEGLSKYITRISIIGGTLTAIIVLLASMAPEFWLNLVYSDEYAGYGWLVIGWSIYYFIGYFHRPYGIALRALKQTRTIFSGSLAGAIATITICYPAMAYLGAEGAMMTLIASQLVITTYYFRAYKIKLATQK